MDAAGKKAELKSLESEKAQMIARYMSLQDQADSVNDAIYKTCCGVEAINVKIEALKKELEKAPANGTSHPPAGVSKSKPV